MAWLSLGGDKVSEGDKGLDGRGTGVDGVQKSSELYDVLGLDDRPERGLVLEDG